jgi:hypothetical protein
MQENDNTELNTDFGTMMVLKSGLFPVDVHFPEDDDSKQLSDD